MNKLVNIQIKKSGAISSMNIINANLIDKVSGIKIRQYKLTNEQKDFTLDLEKDEFILNLDERFLNDGILLTFTTGILKSEEKKEADNTYPFSVNVPFTPLMNKEVISDGNKTHQNGQPKHENKGNDNIIVRNPIIQGNKDTHEVKKEDANKQIYHGDHGKWPTLPHNEVKPANNDLESLLKPIKEQLHRHEDSINKLNGEFKTINIKLDSITSALNGINTVKSCH